MADSKQVINDIQRCICHVPDACRDCSRFGNGDAFKCMEGLLADALELLKEHEPVKPTLKRKWKNKFYDDYKCPVCGNDIYYEQKYCSECGQGVNWND